MSEKIDFFALMRQTAETEEPQKKEIKDAEIVEKETAVNEPEKEVKKEIKKETKKTSKSKPKAKDKEEKYLYPFSLYTSNQTIDISNYGFEEGKEYTGKEISDIMLQHRHWQFAGEMTYSMIKDENVLTVTEKQYKKG